MQYRKNIRRATVTMVAASAAALLATGCQPGDDKAAPAATAAASSAPSAISSAAPTHASGSAAPVKETSATTAAAAPVCTATELNVDAHQAKQRPNGTGIGAAIVAFTNTSARACTLQGFPTVAGAANGSPEHNAPLTVTHTGSAAPVRLAPGGKGWVKLTFVQTQGEADGYCVSGATPVAYPTMVVGLPGAGAHQVALDDGLWAECDNKVTTTAVLAVSPS